MTDTAPSQPAAPPAGDVAVPVLARPRKPREIRKFEGVAVDSRTARRFLASTVAIVALLVGAVVAGGVVVDPHAQFGSPGGYEPLIPDIARLKLDRFEARADDPPVVVVGSSKSGLIPPDAWGGPGTGFNFGLSGPTMADLQAVTSYVVREAHPDVVLIEVDVFEFIEGKESQLASSTARAEMTGEARAAGDLLEDLAATLDPVLWKDAGRVLWYDHVAGYPAARVEVGPNGEATLPFLAEGDWGASDAAAKRAVADYAIFAPGGSRAEHVALDPAQKAALGQAVADALAGGAEVVLFVPPRHPAAYAILQESVGARQAFDQVLGLARSLCAPGVQVHDLLSPEVAGLAAEDFYDGHHTTVDAGRRLVDRMQDRGSDACAGPEP